MKLQKLAWYVKVWSLIAGKNCIQAGFKKWDFGPVNIDIFSNYKIYTKQAIPPPGNQPKLNQDTAALFTFILDNYIDLSAVALSDLTHNEEPWKKTKDNDPIQDNDIISYYSGQSFAKNFLNKKFNEGKFWVLKTNSWHSFTLDMDKQESSTYEFFDSYDEYLTHKNEAQVLLKDIWKKSTVTN